jgi:hypothetical protein
VWSWTQWWSWGPKAKLTLRREVEPLGWRPFVRPTDLICIHSMFIGLNKGVKVHPPMPKFDPACELILKKKLISGHICTYVCQNFDWKVRSVSPFVVCQASEKGLNWGDKFKSLLAFLPLRYFRPIHWKKVPVKSSLNWLVLLKGFRVLLPISGWDSRKNCSFERPYFCLLWPTCVHPNQHMCM